MQKRASSRELLAPVVMARVLLFLLLLILGLFLVMGIIAMFNFY